MKLVVGLGNPGPKYDATRHNIGYAVVDYLAAAPGVTRWRSRFESQVAEAVEGTEQVLLIKPETFMNLSGRAVRAATDFYKLAPPDLLIVCDDIALPLGKLRMRAKGSHGGQKGLLSVQESLGSQEYPRLRIGVGSPGDHWDAADYVLSRFKPGERAVVADAVAQAAQAVLVWVRDGIDASMNRFNADPQPAKPKKEKPEARTRKEPPGDTNPTPPKPDQ